MEYTFRWFGPKDPFSLNEIRQIGITGIVSSLANIEYGKTWKINEIKKRKKFIEKHKVSEKNFLKWSVVESLPVHNDIKKRAGKYKYYIDQYKDSLVNLAKEDIKIICYNFMPLIDWVRTNLNFELSNGSFALKYNHLQMCAFESHILKCKNIKNRYSAEEIKLSKKILNSMSSKDINLLKYSLLGGLAANDRKFSIKDLNYEIDSFVELDHKDLRSNLKLFIGEIYPILKEFNMKYCIHPDDPPYNIFGLPRIMSNQKDIDFITSLYNDDTIGFTLCTGSLGVNYKNNFKKIITKYGKFINFIHLRNIKRYSNSLDFHEETHLEGDVDMVEVIELILKEEKRRKKNNLTNFDIPMRPDHGHTILYDQKKKIIPGYSLLGRMKGLAEIKGIIKVLK